jgi:hypothetical protein
VHGRVRVRRRLLVGRAKPLLGVRRVNRDLLREHRELAYLRAVAKLHRRVRHTRKSRSSKKQLRRHVAERERKLREVA